MSGRRVRWGAGRVFVLFVLTVSPLAAQRTEFEPALGLRYVYRNNIQYTVEPEVEDSSLRAFVLLPVVRNWQTGSFNLVYRLTGEKFDLSEEFDHISHRLSVGVLTQPSRRSNLSFGLFYRRTQDQGGPLTDEEEEDFDPTFTGRIWEELYSARLSYDQELSRRWGVNFRARAGRQEFSSASSQDADPLPAGARDRSGYLTSFTVLRELSVFSSTGMRVWFQRFDLETDGITDSVGAAWVFNRDEAERLAWTLQLGGYRREKTSGINEGEVRNGFHGSFRLGRQFKKTDFVFLALHRLNAGGARLGTSVNSDVRIGLRDTFHRRWGWRLFARWGRRDPQTEAPVIDTYEAGARLVVQVTRKIGFDLAGTYGAQTSDLPDADFAPFYRVAVSAVWTPLGTVDLNDWPFF